MLIKFLMYTVGMVVITFVTGFFWIFYYQKPLEQAKSKIDEKHQTLKKRLRQGERYDDEIKQLRRQISEKKRAIVSLLREKTKNRDVGKFLNDVELDASNSSIKLKSIRIHPKTQRQRYMEIPMEFSIEGPYFGLFDFFKRVEAKEMLNLINSQLSLSGGGSDRGVKVKNLSDIIDKSKKLRDINEKEVKMQKYSDDTEFPLLRVQFDGRIILIDKSHIARYEE